MDKIWGYIMSVESSHFAIIPILTSHTLMFQCNISEVMPLYKIWNAARTVKRAIIASSLEELKEKGKLFSNRSMHCKPKHISSVLLTY